MIKELLEQLAPLDAQIAALRGGAQDEDSQMAAITAHASELAELAVEEDEILRCCGPLTAEDRVFLARHPERPHIDETINALFTDFFEQCGDRQCREDRAILGGIARFHGMPVTVIGHRKGSTLEENMACNFGMPGPEGYRKALRLMKQAEKFGRPIITFIDTPGAYPGKEAEERGQGEAIARNLMYRDPNYYTGFGNSHIAGDWVHTNSMSVLGPNKWYDAGDKRFHPDNIIIDCRDANIILIIEKATGNIVWKIGPYFDQTPELRKLG